MAKTVITINTNGSVRVEGDDFVIVDPMKNEFDLNGRQKISLCRCGLSSTKPFCDGSHKGVFLHDVKAYQLPPMPAPNPAPDKI